MWISSLVVTLPQLEEHAALIRDAIAAIPVFQPGKQIADRLPLVLEVEDGSQARDWYDWVSGLAGVVKVDLAFASFEDLERENDVTEKAVC